MALVGGAHDLTISHVKQMAKDRGLLEQCHFFESIPNTQVADILAASSVAVHLSAAEGTNRASYEAWLCNTPLIVYRHCMGFRTEYINEHTGRLADDNELADTIEYCIDNRDTFSPRDWLLQRSGYKNATAILNTCLRDIALELGEPWTRDIVEKKNGPNLMYAGDEVCSEMQPAYLGLQEYLN